MNILDVLQAIAAHHWPPLILFACLLGRFLASDKSRFPATLPDEWLHLVSAGFGGLYGVFYAHQLGAAWWPAAAVAGVATAVAGGMLDALLAAIWHGRAPGWARALVMIASADAGKSGVELPPPSKPPLGGAGGAALGLLLLVLLGAPILVSDCAATKGKEPEIAGDVGAVVTCVLAHQDETPEQVASTCGGQAVGDVIAILAAHRLAERRALAADVLRAAGCQCSSDVHGADAGAGK